MISRFSAALLAAALVTLAPDTTAQVGRSQGVIDPNVASDSQLALVPGLTPELRQAIVRGRPFGGMLALDSLLGRTLSREQRTELYRHIFIHLNLRTALREEILLVPGVGRRMAHEFEEYRPWNGGLAQFRREIRKYVDSAEVARLEQYVFVPINLNTASDDDILSIPGVGRRMLHEFKEYRPYRDMDRFRREIGKYVSAREVERLARYVGVE